MKKYKNGNMAMNLVSKVKVGIISTSLALVACISIQGCSKDVSNKDQSSNRQEVRVEMRQLWAEHMEWTYATVDAFFHDQAGLTPKLNRLLQNQEDIGNSIKPYFGNEAGEKLAKLLTEHIQLAVPVLSAAQNGNNASLEEAIDNWYANAQEIGDDFAILNPKAWDQEALRDIWKTHITQTVGYSVALLQNNLDDAIAQYQQAYDHMMEMADEMTDGIVNK